MRRPTTIDRAQAGLTLLEVMIASAVMVIMMGLAWKTISNTATTKNRFEQYEQRNHELRMAMGRIVADLEASYLSRNDDQNQAHPRTMFVAKSGSKLPEIRFSTLGHRALWADANESEQTVIEYQAHSNRQKSGQTDWLRREFRRPSNEPPEEVASDYDVLVSDIESAKLEFFNWRTTEWQDSWDTTQSDGQRGMLPSRVRVTIIIKGAKDAEYKLVSEARLMLQEPLTFVQ